MRRLLWTLLAVTGMTATAHAEVVVKPVEYRDGNQVLEGLLVHDDAVSGKRPGVLLAHGAGGTVAASRQRATQLARLGYVVFAADLYGKGFQPKDAKEAAARAGLTGKDRKAVRARLGAALKVLAEQKLVDDDKLAAVGYGVGGSAVLELARGGADLEGVVCLHGDLTTPTPQDAKKISASVLVLVGTDDPLIPLSQLATFEDEMRAGGVDWQVIRYGGAVHDFTNPQAGRDLKKGRAYDAEADARAAEAIRVFLVEQFPPPKKAAAKAATPAPKSAPALPKGVPAKVVKVLEHADKTGRALDGYEGGRNFLNIERLLPQKDAEGGRLRYREWDVNPLKPGVNRGAERLVTGSDGSAYYTDDHYRSFKKIR